MSWDLCSDFLSSLSLGNGVCEGQTLVRFFLFDGLLCDLGRLFGATEVVH